MANHDKGKPTSARGHCKMCKPWKINGITHEGKYFEKYSDHKRRIWSLKEILEWLIGYADDEN